MTASASRPNPFGARGPLGPGFENTTIYRLSALAGQSGVALERLPVTIRILLENLLRTADLTPSLATNDDILSLASWAPDKEGVAFEFPFMPARVLLQDFTGVPAVVDLAAMRDAVRDLGGDPDGINPLVPADLVIDHSVQVDAFGTILSFATNVEREYERNSERYMLLRWAQGAFRNFSVVPPGTGIVHQVNLEYLGKVVQTR
ncbi:MAG TPA: aconitase family protein, partial [Ktedonobacterales bacterium]